jgi:hypothetical protein
MCVLFEEHVAVNYIIILKERDYLEDPGVGGRIILRWIFRNWYGGIDWIDLVRDRDWWRAL